MAQVSSQTQLLTALAAQDSIIQITNDFTITSQITILYPVTIESLTPAAPFTLTKDTSYFAYLFRVQNGGSLTLQNIILDGDKDRHPMENPNNRSLIYVTGGTLNLLDGSVIRNNNAYLEGGGIYLNRNESYPNTLSMSGNALITGCCSRTNGGGIMLAVGNTQDSFHISGLSQIDANQGANGGGIYCRSYIQDVPCVLSISDQVHITNNQATSSGGGIWFSGFRDESTAPSALTLTGNVLVSGNLAANGAGIYFSASNTDDRLAITESTSIIKNTASQNGGGCNMQANKVPANFSVDNASISDNTAGTGGGIYLLTDSGAHVNFFKSKLTGNQAINDTSGSGGGIWIHNQSKDSGVVATLTDIILENNQASAHAGGMALYAGAGAFTFHMTGGTVSNNLTMQEGGGFVISNEGPGDLTFHQTIFSQNTANGSGGGIYYASTGEGNSSTFTMTGATIFGNTAGKSGGGLRLSSGTGTLVTLLEDCTINSNTALSNSGGGIWNGGNHDRLKLSGTSTVTGNRTVSGNGGGIYFNSDTGTIFLTDTVKISENRADEVVTDFGNHGGGIWNHGNSVTTLTNGTITNNKAVLGNSIYNDSILYMKGTRELKDGVYLASASSIISLVDPLTRNSQIQLELSSYVTPNSNGTPIVVGEGTASYPLLTQEDADAFLEPPQDFEGWEIQLNSDNTQVLLAPVNYQIQYENLMSAVNPNPVSYTITTPTIELLPPHSISGYRFLGWFEAITGGNQIISIPHGSSGNMTIYARWEKITELYTVTFCGNDNCWPKACHIPAQISLPDTQEVTLPSVIPQRKFYCFCGWNTDCCGRGISYLPGETITSVNADLTLYAIWKRSV